MTDFEERFNVARFVATYWRDEYLAAIDRDGTTMPWAIGTHPLALILAALDGETDPRELGIPERLDKKFRDALEEIEVPA